MTTSYASAQISFTVGEALALYLPASRAERPQIRCSRDAFTLLFSSWSTRINWLEEFAVMCLNPSKQVIGIYHVGSGGVSGCYADLKVIFQIALGCNAHSILIAHNHPSGNTRPSQADKDLTSRIKDAGIMLECPVIDHIILTPDETYLSFADEGIL